MAIALASTDVVHQTGHFEGDGGLKLFRQSWRPNRAARGALVVVHGLKDHSSRYAALAQRLAQDGYAVHAMDLRGHAASSGDRVWVDSFDQYAADLDLFVNAVRKDEGEVPLFVMGHSMGGAIVTTWTLGRDPKVSGIILSAPALKKGDDISGFLVGVTRVLGSVFPRLAVLDLPKEKFSRDPAVIADMEKDPLVDQGKGPARTAKELLNALEAIGQKMPEFKHPVLLLHGTQDGLTNPEGSRELHQKAASTDKTLKIYEGLFHDLLHEPEREQVMRDIHDWLNARAPN